MIIKVNEAVSQDGSSEEKTATPMSADHWSASRVVIRYAGMTAAVRKTGVAIK